MPNTVFGPYAPHTWINGDSANATRLNNLESQASDALHGFNPDMIGAGFVYSGITTAKDGSVANQLDIASGVAYVVFSDGTVGRITVVTDNTHTTATPSTTYHLYLQPDGTWYWNTANTPVANSLHICDVTTDGSGNIATVTDQRVTGTSLFPAMLGALSLPKIGGIAGQATAGSFGVPVTIAAAKDVHVVNTSSTTICTVTTPNDGANHAVRFWGGTSVGSGASNNGVCSFSFGFSDPNSGATSQVAPNWNGSSVVAFSALTVGKGLLGASTLPTELLCAPNTTVSVIYQNTAAGTITDKVSGTIELLT